MILMLRMKTSPCPSNPYKSEENETPNTKLFNTEAILRLDRTFDLRKLSNPNELSDINLEDTSKGYFAVRTGSGSTVEGSNHSDTIIISLRQKKNENPNNFLDLGPCQHEKLRVLNNLSKVVGGPGNDQLLFMIDTSASNNLLSEHNLKIANIKTSSGKLSEYSAIISNDIIISFVKDIETIKAFIATDGVEDFVEISAQLSDPIDENKMTCSSAEVAALFKNIKEDTPTNSLDVSYTADSDGFFFLEPQKLVGTNNKDVLAATSRRDTLLGGAGNDRLIGAVTDDPSKDFDDEGNHLSTRFFDGPGNDYIEPKAGNILLF